MLFFKGMGLMLNYNPNSTNKDYVRSGIGFKPDGSLVIIISKDKLTFWTLAERFKAKGCTNAIYLDGYADLTGYVGYSSEFGRVGMVDKAIKLQFFHVNN